MDTINDVWNEVLEVCKTKVSDVMFNLWFKPLDLIKFENNTFVFAVSTDFKKSIITDKFLPIIKEGFEQVMGFPVEIAVLVRHTPAALMNDKEKKAPAAVEYTFDNFIEGKSNAFAYTVAKAVAQNPGLQHNPLLIYGRSGLGKTHLMLAIDHEMRLHYPNMTIIYSTGEEMMNEMLKGLNVKNMNPFRDKFRSCDALLVDDIQFVQKSDAFQEEFFHTFDTLYRAGKQIVITSDRPPRDMPILDERLKTRFEQGVLADVQAPDYETRRAIILKKCERLELDLPKEVVEYIANNIKNNIRQLEGTVNKLQAMKKTYQGPVTLEQAVEAVRDVTKETEPVNVTVDNIIKFVANIYGITPEDIKSDNRSADIMTARQVTIYVIKEVTNLKLQQIGNVFGKKHSTVMHSINQVKSGMESDQRMKSVVVDTINEFTKY